MYHRAMFIRGYCPINRIVLLVLSLCVVSGCTHRPSATLTELKAVQYKPIERSDWFVSTPTAEGVDPMMVARLFLEAGRHPTLHGLLVFKNDHLIAEKYFNKGGINHVDDRMSVTKSFLSALVGIALAQGCLASLEQKMSPFFPEVSVDNERKENITIRDMLQMRAGYPWEGRSPSYLKKLFFTEDWYWIKHLADFPLTAAPGMKFGYSNLTSYLLGVIVSRACKQNLLTMLNQYILNPLDTQSDKWHKSADGYHFGALGLFVTARDMAKFGHLYMNLGMFNAKQILPPDWVRMSFEPTTKAINITGWYFGSSELGRYFRNVAYGFQWWSAKVGHHKVHFAWGHGGNLIVIIQALKMVIVTTADPLYNYPEGKGWPFEGAIIDLVGRFINSLPKAANNLQ